MLGIGIFIGPPQTAGALGSPTWFVALWLLGGLFALAGALSVAELGAMLPSAGGDYPYLRRAYGPGIAFAAGWLQLGAIFPGSLATMAVATATYQLPVIFGQSVGEPVTAFGIALPPALWAALIIVLLTALNHLGVVLSGVAQVLLTLVPVIFFVGASLFALVHGTPSEAGAGSVGPTSIGALATGYLPVYFAYAGWYAALFVGSEVRRPERNLPLGLIGGTVLVTALYGLIAVALLSVFSLGELAAVGEAGTALAAALFGPTGAYLMTVMIACAMLASINGTALTGARIAYAMAQEGEFPARGGRLHPRHETPTYALWVQAGLSLVLVSLGEAEALLSYTTAAMFLTGALTVYAVVRLRRLRPDLERPYRTWLYPVTPLLYVGSTLLAVIVLAYQRDLSVLLAAGWFAAAYGVHRLVLSSR